MEKMKKQMAFIEKALGCGVSEENFKKFFGMTAKDARKLHDDLEFAV